MTSNELKCRLNSGRLNKIQIDELVQRLQGNQHLTKPLLEEVFAQDASGDSFNASWVFDHLMRKELDYLLPHLDIYVHGTANLKTQSCIRPMAHVMELLNEAVFKHKTPEYTRAITLELKEQMTTICFDWLIGDYKVATKVFAMTCLFYLGEEYEWIRPELKSIIALQITEGTVGFKNRGSKILGKLIKLGY